MYMYMYASNIYIYIEREREKERDSKHIGESTSLPQPATTHLGGAPEGPLAKQGQPRTLLRERCFGHPFDSKFAETRCETRCEEWGCRFEE